MAATCLASARGESNRGEAEVKVWLSWSSGKDSAWALEVLRATPGTEVTGLFTAINGVADRVAMHGVRRALVEAQAAAAGLPLRVAKIPYPCPNGAYEQAMADLVGAAKDEGVEAMAFGDLFLGDVRAYREARLAGTGLEPLFPLWGRDTRRLAHETIAGGLVAHLTAVDPAQIETRFVGRRFDERLLAELPASADPCGENGEFHTFVSAGPMLANPIAIVLGEVVERDGLVFQDVLPA
ncbi:MAG: ATP-binding protein [Pseudomonadota bacterium]